MFSKLISALALIGTHAAFLFLPEFAAAQSRTDPPGPIDPSPIPTGWTCAGNCGTDGADGVVKLSPTGNAAYEWVSTSGGGGGVGKLPTGALGSETNGSTLATPVFSATAGTALKFYFNYVTSDGAGYADYAWAELFTSTGTPVALLFTARTEPSGSIVPGTGLPAPLATLTPASVPIIGGGPAWAPLGGSSGTCYSAGCGYTGWVQASYVIPTTGNYYLKVGVVNWIDTAFQSGLAVDGVTIGGTPITLLSGNIEVQYGTDGFKTAWLALATATDSNGQPITMKSVAQQLGFDHFNWLQIITSDLQLQACAANKLLPTCSSDFTNTGSVPSVPTVDPPGGGYAYELCPTGPNCQSSFPAQDFWPMYWDEYFSPVPNTTYYKTNPSAPEYLQEYRAGNQLTQMGANGQSPSQALGFSFSDAPVTNFVVPGTASTNESIFFVDALVGVTGSCNLLISSNCAFTIIPGTTFKWTATNGVVSPTLTPGGPGSSASLNTPSRGVQQYRAKQPVDFPVNPVYLTGPELANSIISVNQFLALANLTPQSLASMGGVIATFSAKLIPSQAGALANALADVTPPVIAPNISGTMGNNGWYRSNVTVTWSVTDPESGIASFSGCGQTTLTNDTAGVTLTCFAKNGAGLSSSVPVTIKIDKTPPVISGMPAQGCTLWPPNHKFVQVGEVKASDALSSLVPGSLKVIGTSNEPIDPLDPQIVITPDGSGGFIVQLKAERLGNGSGRVYTLTATANDLAGNTTTVKATCSVPHDQGN